MFNLYIEDSASSISQETQPVQIDSARVPCLLYAAVTLLLSQTAIVI